MLAIRITDVVPLLVTVESRGTCDWDIKTACCRQEELKEAADLGRDGWIYMDAEVKGDGGVRG